MEVARCHQAAYEIITLHRRYLCVGQGMCHMAVRKDVDNET